MTERHGFWTADSPVADPYVYSASEFAEMQTKGNWRDGVCLGVLNELEVLPVGGNKYVRVNTGEAVLNGQWYQNDSFKDILIPDHAGTSRTDRIVVRWDNVDRVTTVERLAGTEDSTTPPELTQNYKIWEISLAIVYVSNANLTTDDIAEDRIFCQPYARTIQRNFNLIENSNGLTIGGSTEPWEIMIVGALVQSNVQQRWGPYSLRFSSTWGGHMRQTIPKEMLIANRPHYVAAWVYVQGGECTMRISTDTTNGLASEWTHETLTAAAAWTRLYGTFVPTGSEDVYLDFIGTGAVNIFFVDMVQMLEGGSHELYVPGDDIDYTQRTVFVPCVEGYNVTISAKIPRGTAQGWITQGPQYTRFAGNWNVPYDYQSGTDILIDVIVSCSGGGGANVVYVKQIVNYAYWSECWTTGEESIGFVTSAPGNVCVVQAVSEVQITLTGSSSGDTLFLLFDRDGGHGSDTFAVNYLVVGFLITYQQRDNLARG